MIPTLPRVTKGKHYLIPDLLPETPSLIYSCYTSYFPQRTDEIKLSVDDVVAVGEWDDNGWAKGKNITTGKSGYFPLIVLVSPATINGEIQVPNRPSSVSVL